MVIKKQNISDEAHKKKRKIQEREIKERLNHITNKILVMSGKGGVGKSSVAAYLSVALAKRGYRVGLYGRGSSWTQHPSNTGPERKYSSGR